MLTCLRLLGLGVVVTCLAAGTLCWSAAQDNKDKRTVGRIPPPPKTVQFPNAIIKPQLIEASAFIRVGVAREKFQVSGDGLAAAVLDTGLRSTHVDFKGRVIPGKNFTSEGAGEDDTSDLDGHGTNVTGIVGAGGALHLGMAPKANLIPLKVLSKDGGDFGAVARALQWVLDNRTTHNITVVNMSLGDSGNYQKDDSFADDAAKVQELIKKLRQVRVAVVVAAGNAYHAFSPEGQTPQQGMGFPAAVRETVSVGAVFDRFDTTPIEFVDGTVVFSQKPNGITGFSQRLDAATGLQCRTDIFAPGSPIISSGNGSDDGQSVESGTSQASPIAAGVILLLQESYKKKHGELPTIDQIESFLRSTAVKIIDGKLEDDNVAHTQSEFLRLDAYDALSTVSPSTLGTNHDFIRNNLFNAKILKPASSRQK